MTTSANATPGKSPDELDLLTDYSVMQIGLGKRFFSRPNAALSAIPMDPKGPQAHPRFGPSHRVLSRFTIAAPNRWKCLVFQVKTASTFAFSAQRAIKAS